MAEEAIDLQLTEFYMIQSMFPEEDAIEYDINQIQSAKDFIEGHLDIPGIIEYGVNIQIGQKKIKLDIKLPSLYPLIERVQIYVRGDSLNRDTQLALNAELSSYLAQIDESELQVGCAISWVQEHAIEYITCEPTKVTECVADWQIARFWIYAHHIFSKTKRKDMKKYADEFEITGFVLPGKPGIICVEGTLNNVEAWWHTVRSWCWQRISCIHEEKQLIDREELSSSFYRFKAFKELSPIDIKAKTQKTFDMSAFQKYLEDNHSGYMFKKIFNL